MLIHAFRRNGPVTVDTGVGEVEFTPNAQNEFVADATEAQAAVLLNIPEAYKAHGKAQAAAKPSKQPAAAPVVPVNPAAGSSDADEDRGKGKPFLLKAEDPKDDVDLGPMTMTELKAFAKANTFTVKKAWTEAELRQKLFEEFDTAE